MADEQSGLFPWQREIIERLKQCDKQRAWRKGLGKTVPPNFPGGVIIDETAVYCSLVKEGE